MDIWSMDSLRIHHTYIVIVFSLTKNNEMATKEKSFLCKYGGGSNRIKLKLVDTWRACGLWLNRTCWTAQMQKKNAGKLVRGYIGLHGYGRGFSPSHERVNRYLIQTHVYVRLTKRTNDL